MGCLFIFFEKINYSKFTQKDLTQEKYRVNKNRLFVIFRD